MPLLTNNTIGKQQIIHIKKGVSLLDTPFLITFMHRKRLRDSILSPIFHSYIFAMYKNESLWI